MHPRPAGSEIDCSRPASNAGYARLTMFAAALALVAFTPAHAASAPSAAASSVTAAPAPPPAPRPVSGPIGSAQAKPRMWAVSLSSMEVYENGSGYLYGFWRQFGETAEKPARLYWGRGCPDISDRVYHVLQAGFAQQSQFYLVVDRAPDPRQPGAFCVRGVELELRRPAGSPPTPPSSPPASTPPLMK